ncbi:MAG: glycosyltransferase [Actinobacteria bacterium HGW-Actinobacteria-7]|nr:MAG: glycosyltransferase [Actinobacteria bacterium HGW-Actinobacteria-7]
MSSARTEILGLPMDLLTMRESVQACENLMNSGRCAQHVVVNAAKIVAAHDDPGLANMIADCDVINIDGMSVVWAGRLLGHRVPERVAGIDLMDHLLALCARKGFSVFFLGATDVVLSEFLEIVRTRYPELVIAGSHSGYFDDDERIASSVRDSGASLLLLGISSPRKEIFASTQKDSLGPLLVMGVGGSFDVWAGRTRRAPLWMQTMGLEWLYRVVQEPRRMWRRYLVGNARFIGMLARELFAPKRTHGDC